MADDGSSPTQSSQELPQLRSVSVCAEAVESYRAGRITKVEALSSIIEQLRGSESGGDDVDTSDSTLQSYLNQLDEVDAARGEEDVGDNEREREFGRQASQSGTEHGRSDAGNQRDRVRAPDTQGSSGDASDSDERPTKRSRADPSKYAWAASEFLLETQLRPEVQRTLDLIRVYGEDVTQAKRDLAATASAPEFPDAEWTNVLLGRAVDLDRVFAGHYTSTADESLISERIGDLELRYRPPAPAKKIQSFGDWVYAWNRASVAIAFAFPHRRSELVEYGNHIIALFGALAEPLHPRVLEYDRAVRKRVGSARRYLLTDFADFADLKIQYIDSGGANVFAREAPTSSAAGRGSSRRQKEACRNWNRGECPRKASECRYRHVCSFCGAEGHARPRCNKAANRSS
ncbi:hypothetical protein FKP32DRAFT_1586028 [Trametes sanguinea]|nr:hypothetical protein FKP32DRAFT_1586028 [Trametes sanguinea]